MLPFAAALTSGTAFDLHNLASDFSMNSLKYSGVYFRLGFPRRSVCRGVRIWLSRSNGRNLIDFKVNTSTGNKVFFQRELRDL